MADPKAGASESRVIRVFLSSTFRDFMEERDLLVKQVFPDLNRRARERGVEVVDVDLRWGITEEESRQGKVIPICLGEIDRCRPYFVGMLGERYGWIPPADQYSPEVIERQPWLKNHLGGVSVTELEILHGVLNDPAMAGRAFFYFRDPAWSASQSDPGFVCETTEEATKLADLKQRICNSRFPVVQNIPDPKTLADQIGQDLWELIDQQYPDLDEPDSLEREERQHAAYRRSRLGVYLGGQRYIKKLEGWIDAGQQKILISGESGAGKSALIANWMAAHQKAHPEDVIYAHHLGCSKDSRAIRPLLARLIDTAKQQLPDAYGDSLAVPHDWWELVAKVVEALQSLGCRALEKNQRWIWVLDGVDRLDPKDQNALAWLPPTIPEGVVIIASAMECQTRDILMERKFSYFTIGPLKTEEKDTLIRQYLGRYTKKLIAELRSKIVHHKLSGSPLYLRVLLEELRQCGKFETLDEQLDSYLRAESIDDLYEQVLERVEADGNGENVRKLMTALWASSSGLSEDELLKITGLATLHLAPIDLALKESLRRNGNLLMPDHDYLYKAIKGRYLPSVQKQKEALRFVGNRILDSLEINEHLARNIIASIAKAGDKGRLIAILSPNEIGAKLVASSRPIEILEALSNCNEGEGESTTTLMLDRISEYASIEEVSSETPLLYWSMMGELALQSGIPHNAAVQCFDICCRALQFRGNDIGQYAVALHKRAEAFYNIGDYVNAEDSLLKFLKLNCTQKEISKAWVKSEGDSAKGISRESSLSLLGIVLGEQLRFHEAEQVLREVAQEAEAKLGKDHPTSMTYKNNWLLAMSDLRGNKDIVEDGSKGINSSDEHRKIYDTRIRILGRDHIHTLVSQNNLAIELFRAC